MKLKAIWSAHSDAQFVKEFDFKIEDGMLVEICDDKPLRFDLHSGDVKGWAKKEGRVFLADGWREIVAKECRP